jgi:hypothetical protein
MTFRLILAGILLVVFGGVLTEVTSSHAPERASVVSDATSTPTAPAKATPESSSPVNINNRADCDEIRGTPYRSEDERVWYQTKCVIR